MPPKSGAVGFDLWEHNMFEERLDRCHLSAPVKRLKRRKFSSFPQVRRLPPSSSSSSSSSYFPGACIEKLDVGSVVGLIRCSHGAPFFSTTTTFARPQLFPPTFALRSWQKKVDPALSRYRWQQGAPGQFLGFLIDRLAVIWYGKYFWILQQLFSCHILNLVYRVPRKSMKLKKRCFPTKAHQQKIKYSCET